MTGSSRGPAGTRWWLVASWLLGLLALAAVVGAGAHLGDIEHFVALADRVSPAWLLVLVALQAGTYLGTGMTWHIGLRANGEHLSLRALAPLVLAKLFVDQTVPSGGMSGTVFLTSALVGRGIPAPACLSTLLLNLVGRYAAFLLAAFATLVLLRAQHVAQAWMTWVVVAFSIVSLVAPAAVLWMRRFGRREPRWLQRFPRLAAFGASFADAPVDALRRPRLVAASIALNTAVIACDAATLWASLHALGEATPYRVAFPCYVLATMVMALGPIPLGLGTFEATCTASLVLLGVPIESALTATLLLRGLTTWLPMAPGFVLARRELHARDTREGRRPSPGR